MLVSPDRKAVAELVDHRIGELGLTITEVCTRSKVSAHTLRKLLAGEQGNYRPGPLRAISRALQWSPLAIEEFAASGKEPLHVEAPPVALQDPVAAMATMIQGLDYRIAQLEASLRMLTATPLGGRP